MLPKYGSYSLADGRCEITRRDTPLFNDAHQLLSNTIRLDCSSALYAESASQMDGFVRSLLTAFRTGGKDFIVYLPGGKVKSQLSLPNANAIGGVRVVQPPELRSLQRGGYVTWLEFTFSLEAEYPAANSGLLYREYSDSVQFSSPDRFAWLLCLHGPHQLQNVRQFPFYKAIQTGRAVGYRNLPEPAQPLWPHAWMNSDEPPGRDSPKFRGTDYTDFVISWNYRFESDRPLRGGPTVQPF